VQKLTGISLGKNNKSCGISLPESNKISFAFFRFLYDFLCNLQETGKSLYYWSYHFVERPSERFVALQCGPWGRLASLAGQGLGKGARVTRVQFGGSDSGEKPPVGGHAGGQERWPPWLPMPGEGGSGRDCGRRGLAPGEAREVGEGPRWRVVGRNRSSSRLPKGAGGGSVRAGRSGVCRG
jgi:hypothetical protein